MHSSSAPGTVAVVLIALLALVALTPSPADSACCYFAAAGQDVQQPAQKAFLTWDPAAKAESFTVQPKFEGNARDFGMVIPTPARPRLDEMPRDFFKELAVFTILKQREQPMSSLMPPAGIGMLGGLGALGGGLGAQGGFVGGMPLRPPTVTVLERGVVGSLDYKILTAGRADDLYTWLKENKYKYAGDEATLDFYVKKKWVFTVMKIDTMQMKRNADGSYTGEVTPTRFQFASEKLVYPLKITSLSVKDKTDALFYIQAPQKMDLPGDRTYQFQWIALLQNAKGLLNGQKLPGGGDAWLEATKPEDHGLLRRRTALGFSFVAGQPPGPNPDGVTPTSLEWAKRLTKKDVGMLTGRVPFSEKVPDVDEGFTPADLKNPRRAKAARLVIAKRLEKCRVEHPDGYLVREAPAKDVKGLRILAGHLKEGRFLTKLRKAFTRDEMNDDLEFVPARVGKAEDRSEYEEVLPSAPP